MNRIKQFRIENKISQKDLAMMMGISQSLLSMVENNEASVTPNFAHKFNRVVRETMEAQIPKEISTNQPPHSDHYHTGKIDVWQFAEENFSIEENIGYHRINALKYISRYGKKEGFNQKDLDKAIAEIQKLRELTK